MTNRLVSLFKEIIDSNPEVTVAKKKAHTADTTPFSFLFGRILFSNNCRTRWKEEKVKSLDALHDQTKKQESKLLRMQAMQTGFFLIKRENQKHGFLIQ